ncbi:hypothetical protein GCM10016272_02260 [Psychrobacter glaciei]|uniref:CPXCG motif-containing cysteine-rich protein n=1 Tax=Psychrobacter glaciei TaxID=619771 RepID=A0ABQ3GNB5_9GAMM|nr:hypothetical protein [Psychrobacter glaciei]GHD25915.1 hypothetical protein GCM10016272_02260 [Psychrobacter glaciei]
MSRLFVCPHCKHGISTEHWSDEGIHDFKTWDEECPECEEVFEVVVMIDVRFELSRNYKESK